MISAKTVLITGATSGIGESLLKEYIGHGYHIFACGRNKNKLDELSLLYPEKITPFAFDITQPAEIETMAKKIASVDILLFNAGDCQYLDDVMKFDGNTFANIININLQSLGYLLQHLLPKVSSTGQVVFVSSSATILPFPKAQAYGASKAGVDYLAKSLALDLKNTGIDVTLVHPGFIKTPLTDKNTFDMPFILSSDEAASRIYQGVNKRKAYLHFPKRLTWLLKCFSVLPEKVWQSLILRSQH